MQHECNGVTFGELALCTRLKKRQITSKIQNKTCRRSVQLLNNVDIHHVTDIGDYTGWLYWGHIGSIHRVHEKLREGNSRLQDYTNTLDYYTLTRTTPLPTCITNFEIYNGHQSTWVNQLKKNSQLATAIRIDQSNAWIIDYPKV